MLCRDIGNSWGFIEFFWVDLLWRIFVHGGKSAGIQIDLELQTAGGLHAQAGGSLRNQKTLTNLMTSAVCQFWQFSGWNMVEWSSIIGTVLKSILYGDRCFFITRILQAWQNWLVIKLHLCLSDLQCLRFALHFTKVCVIMLGLIKSIVLCSQFLCVHVCTCCFFVVACLFVCFLA